jgi:hypothetical protein
MRRLKLLYEEILVNFVVPQEVITDRGRNFLSQELKGFMDLVDIRHLKTSA